MTTSGRHCILQHEFNYAHLPELADLWVAAWTKAMPSIDFEARRVWIVERLIGLHDGGVAIICGFDSADGGMAGFIALDADTGHIDQIAVAPGHWGSSAAGQLLAAAKQQAPGRLTLEVNQDNARAIRGDTLEYGLLGPRLAQ